MERRRRPTDIKGNDGSASRRRTLVRRLFGVALAVATSVVVVVATTARSTTAGGARSRRRASFRSDKGLGIDPPSVVANIKPEEYWKGKSIEGLGIDDGVPYELIRKELDAKYPPDDTDRLIDLAESLRNDGDGDGGRRGGYEPMFGPEDVGYDLFNCPDEPPAGYPRAWNVMDVLNNWNPDETLNAKPKKIYQGLCVFDYRTELRKAQTYREREVPFVLRDDPLVLRTVERWNEPGYLRRILGGKIEHRTEYSKSNHFMFWRTKNAAAVEVPEGWKLPTRNVKMTYEEWNGKATRPEEELSVDKDHWYFRLNAIRGMENEFLYDELPMFVPEEDQFYMVDPERERGINCRFGMRGNVAENHFDSSRNFIVLLGGERRYVLSHPSQCPNLALYPKRHPSGRHSAVDWSNPDLTSHPEFRNAEVNEVVLRPGDVMYLPAFWFHYIVSLNLNYQCNARSGMTDHYAQHMTDCGF